LAATSVGSLAFFGGGFDSSNGLSSSTVDIYNALSDSWTTASLSQARHFLQAASTDGLAVFAGGYNGTLYSSVVDVYNISATLSAVPIPSAVVAAEFNLTTPAIAISSSQSSGR
jgi:hypothetical protein